MTQFRTNKLHRRTVVQGSLAAGTTSLIGAMGLTQSATSQGSVPQPGPLDEWTIADAQDAMVRGDVTSADLVDAYLARIEAIDQNGPTLASVLEVNPDCRTIAKQLDDERAAGKIRGPLHGIPVVVKDNIDTADRMHTTAGSLALLGSTPAHDATVAAKLREAGAVILGKTNMSEWANMRGFQSSSGWSGRGGQTLNPYALNRSPSGSSSGSAAAVSANLAMVGLGTETNGSIVSPASACGVVGVKPTVGRTSRAGVIPISDTQDSVGVLARTVTDAAIALSVISGADDRDTRTQVDENRDNADFAQGLVSVTLEGKRFGVATNAGHLGYSPEADEVFAAAADVVIALGAEVVEVEIPTVDILSDTPGPFERMQYEFKRDLNAYLAERNDPDIATLADLIAFNQEHADAEMVYFGQAVFEMSEAITDEHDDAWYEKLSKTISAAAGKDGIDAVLKEHSLDALIAPTFYPASAIDLVHGEQFLGGCSSISAAAGYPIVTVPAGYAFGLPVGLAFLGTAWSEEALLGHAFVFEQATRMRRAPSLSPGSVYQQGAIPGVEVPDASSVGGGNDAATPEASPAATPLG